MEPKISTAILWTGLAAILIGFSGCMCGGMMGVSYALGGSNAGFDLSVFLVRGGLFVLALVVEQSWTDG